MTNIQKADRWFSRYQRLAASNSMGFCKCFTCGVSDHWKNMDWGHWIDREWPGTRWDHRNGGPQCKKCNRIEAGRQELMARKIRSVHGPILQELERKKADYKYSNDKVARVYRRLFNRLEKRRSVHEIQTRAI